MPCAAQLHYVNPHLVLFRCGFSVSAPFFLRFEASARCSCFLLIPPVEAVTTNEVMTAVRAEKPATSRRWKTNGARTSCAVVIRSSLLVGAASLF